MEQFIQSLISSTGSILSPELIIFLISMMPVLELRGGMLAASILGIDWKLAMIICIIGNILPIPFILLFFKKIFIKLKGTRFSNYVNKFESKVMKKSEKVFKYRNFGLFLFVAIPIPGTGAWTGSIIASLFGMDIKHVVISLSAGVLAASVVMAVLSYGVLGAFI